MAPRSMTPEEFANLSDDDIMNMSEPPIISGGVADTSEDTTPGGEAVVAEPVTAQDASPEGDPVAEGDDADDETQVSAGSTTEDGTSSTTPVDGQKDDQPSTGTDADKKASEAAVDYEAAYKKLMAPFKANGKEIQLQSPEEAVRLMQMGANYTKKLQALQPNLKLLKMLENNGLLNEGKLSFLIDLEKKNPAAIQKFLRESGVDPMDIDTSAEPSYKPGNHQVSDEEMAFQTTLDEVLTSDAGKQVVIAVNGNWDTSSKQAIYKDPEVLRVLAEQKSNGIYDKIMSEMERRKILGTLPNTIPVLTAYMRVGQELDQQGLLTPNQAANPAQGIQPGNRQAPQVVETRPAVPKPSVNADRVRAVQATASKPAKPTSDDFNPLSLSDEDFLKSSELARRL